MGFEPTYGGFADSPWKRILLLRLAFTSGPLADFRPYSAAIVPKLFLTLWTLGTCPQLTRFTSLKRRALADGPEAAVC